MNRTIVLGAILLVGCGTNTGVPPEAPGLSPQTHYEDWKNCTSTNLDVRVEACSRIIDSTTETTETQVALASAFNNRGAAFLEAHHYDRALQDYTEAIRLSADNAGILTNRGDAHLRKGNADLAIVDYNHALRLQPRHVDALCGRALAYARNNEYDRAIQDIDEALRLDPDSELAVSAREYVLGRQAKRP